MKPNRLYNLSLGYVGYARIHYNFHYDKNSKLFSFLPDWGFETLKENNTILYFNTVLSTYNQRYYKVLYKSKIGLIHCGQIDSRDLKLIE